MSEERTDVQLEAGEEGILAVRRGKAAKLRAAGRNPFANDEAFSSRRTVADLRRVCAVALIDGEAQRYEAERLGPVAAERFCVAGRIMTRRGFGKASFLVLRDRTGELQLFCKLDILGEGFAELEHLDLGDHVWAEGTPVVTRTGELSLQVDRLRLLSKAMRPLADKWHGLSDVDIRYRRRYVDLVANPEVATTLRSRSIIVQGLRRYLDERGFLEVETPTLHSLVGGAAARPFETHHNALDMDLFLRIAPELYLKRLLVGGLERVYEIGRCYRNEGISTRHNPEFTILEYYLAYADYRQLMDMTEEMLRFVDGHLRTSLEAVGLSAHYAAWKEARPFTFDEPFRRLPMADAVAQALPRLPLGAALPAKLLELAAGVAESEEVRAAAAALVSGFRKESERARAIEWENLIRNLAKCTTEGDRLFAFYEYLVEPFLAEDYRSADGSKSLPVFIMDYPREISPLARCKDSAPELVDRFELFVHSRELCNAFSELNDPEDQAARFQDQVSRKSAGQDETMDYDEDYIRALEHGMPPAAGFGLGVDRLTMMLCAQPSIRDVIAFPLLRAESKGKE